MVITELGVFELQDGGMVLTEIGVFPEVFKAPCVGNSKIKETITQILILLWTL